MVKFKLPTQYIFGENCLEELPNILNESSYKKICILYGGGSVKKNGVFDKLVKQINKTNIKWVEFCGIEPNPKDTTIDKAALYCRKEEIDLIIAVGGGSVIDASKVIGAMISNKNIDKSWNYVENNKIATNPSIDIISVITLSGTGSENNSGSVITNEQLQIKKTVHTFSAVPKYAFIDPSFTKTLSEWQYSSGIFDTLVHLLEHYYGKNTFNWTKEFQFAGIRTLIHNTNLILENKNNFEARSNISWTSTMAINNLTRFNSTCDWNAHIIEHAFSARWDITHGAGLALIFPHYLRIRCNKDSFFNEKSIIVAREAFGLNTVDEYINFIKQFIKQLNLPTSVYYFKEIKTVTNGDIDFIVKHCLENGASISEETIREIISTILEQ